MKTVRLNAFDLQEAVLIAERVHAIRSVAPSNGERILTDSSFEGDYIGAVGELAVCRYFGVPHHHKVRLGGDDGCDIEVNGWNLQVKCTPTQVKDPSLIMADKSKFVAQIGVLTRLRTPTTVELIGCCSRARFLKDATQKVFVDTPDWHLPGSALADIDTIIKHKAAA